MPQAIPLIIGALAGVSASVLIMNASPIGGVLVIGRSA